jgi:hypothetical protein
MCKGLLAFAVVVVVVAQEYILYRAGMWVMTAGLSSRPQH